MVLPVYLLYDLLLRRLCLHIRWGDEVLELLCNFEGLLSSGEDKIVQAGGNGGLFRVLGGSSQVPGLTKQKVGSGLRSEFK